MQTQNTRMRCYEQLVILCFCGSLFCRASAISHGNDQNLNFGAIAQDLRLKVVDLTLPPVSKERRLGSLQQSLYHPQCGNTFNGPFHSFISCRPGVCKGLLWLAASSGTNQKAPKKVYCLNIYLSPRLRHH